MVGAFGNVGDGRGQKPTGPRVEAGHSRQACILEGCSTEYIGCSVGRLPTGYRQELQEREGNCSMAITVLFLLLLLSLLKVREYSSPLSRGEETRA